MSKPMLFWSVVNHILIKLKHTFDFYIMVDTAQIDIVIGGLKSLFLKVNNSGSDQNCNFDD